MARRIKSFIPHPTISERVPLLRGLDSALMARLLAGARIQDHDPATALFDEGDAPDRLHILLKGVVELRSSTGGRDATILLLWPPDVFLPAAALTDEPYLASARALGEVQLLSLDAGVARREVARSRELSRRFLLILAGQFRMAVRHIKDLKLRSGPQRLAAFLLRLIDESGTPGFADLPVGKAVLAARLGFSPETLSRALTVLRGEGLDVRGSRAILIDRERIERFCAPDPLIDGRELGLAVTAF